MPLKSHHLQSKDKTLHHLGSTGPDASFFFFLATICRYTAQKIIPFSFKAFSLEMTVVMVTKKEVFAWRAAHRHCAWMSSYFCFCTNRPLVQMTSVHLQRDVDRKAGGSALCSKCFGIWEGDLWMRLEDTERWIRLHLRSRADRESGISRVLTY